jgi:hypothetical protein
VSGVRISAQLWWAELKNVSSRLLLSEVRALVEPLPLIMVTSAAQWFQTNFSETLWKSCLHKRPIWSAEFDRIVTDGKRRSVAYTTQLIWLWLLNYYTEFIQLKILSVDIVQFALKRLPKGGNFRKNLVIFILSQFVDSVKKYSYANQCNLIGI